MASGFARSVARNGGGSRGGFVGPVRRVVSRAISSRPVVATSRPVTVTPRGQDFVSHYDPSRVIDLDRLKVVKDLRAPEEHAAERGETQSGDNGVMSPSESGGVATGAVRGGKPGAPGTGTTNKLIPLALLAALAIMAGG